MGMHGKDASASLYQQLASRNAKKGTAIGPPVFATHPVKLVAAGAKCQSCVGARLARVTSHRYAVKPFMMDASRFCLDAWKGAPECGRDGITWLLGVACELCRDTSGRCRYILSMRAHLKLWEQLRTRETCDPAILVALSAQQKTCHCAGLLTMACGPRRPASV